MSIQKLINIDQFLKLDRSGKKVVFTNGCFDIIHAGHVQYLEQAKALGEILVVGLNTDSSVRKLKGTSRPVNNEINRAIVLAAMEAVNYVILFDEDTPYNLISKIVPDVLVKGGDWKIEDIIGSDLVLSHGGKVLSLPFWEGLSTTKIIQAIKNKD